MTSVFSQLPSVFWEINLLLKMVWLASLTGSARPLYGIVIGQETRFQVIATVRRIVRWFLRVTRHIHGRSQKCSRGGGGHTMSK